jgi:hypothetical protein
MSEKQVTGKAVQACAMLADDFIAIVWLAGTFVNLFE